MPETLQQKLIRTATGKALRARNDYSDKLAAQLSMVLLQAQQTIGNSILRYRTLGSLPDNQFAAMKGLESLNAEISDALSRMRREHTLAFKRGIKESFHQGIGGGIAEFAEAQMPGYRDLTPDGIDKLATKAFTILDTDALDFMGEYTLVLAGSVHKDVEDGIKRTVMSGIATGKSADQIVRDMGEVVPDKESFRHAGGRVFGSAQQRMETIARTEVLRAHNMGRLKFHQRVGVQKLEWLAVGDERMCNICGALHGKLYRADSFPQQPAHPNCRCTNVVAWPITVCGAE